MTARQAFEGMLTEMNKVLAPSLLLEDFNYFFNKAINQYINKRYNIYDVNQLTTDDVRVLKSSVTLNPTKSLGENATYKNLHVDVTGKNALHGATYEVNLPKDYLHLLNCVCTFEVKKTFKCYDKGTHVWFPAYRLTSDSWATVINNFYMRPSYKRPYYYIHNVSSSSEYPTDPEGVDCIEYTYGKGTKITENEETGERGYTPTGDTNFDRTLTINGRDTAIDLVEYEAGQRYSNPSNVRLEIRYGRDDTVFKLVLVDVDYIKSPLKIRLTQEQMDLVEDTSQILEYPDYVCQEIINELVHLVMENASDPKLQSHPTVTQSIANPAQGLAQQLAQ